MQHYNEAVHGLHKMIVQACSQAYASVVILEESRGTESES